VPVLRKEGGPELRKRYEQKQRATIGLVDTRGQNEVCLCIIQVTTVAGNGLTYQADGVAANAAALMPGYPAVDSSGNLFSVSFAAPRSLLIRSLVCFRNTVLVYAVGHEKKQLFQGLDLKAVLPADRAIVVRHLWDEFYLRRGHLEKPAPG